MSDNSSSVTNDRKDCSRVIFFGLAFSSSLFVVVIVVLLSAGIPFCCVVFHFVSESSYRCYWVGLNEEEEDEEGDSGRKTTILSRDGGTQQNANEMSFNARLVVSQARVELALKNHAGPTIVTVVSFLFVSRLSH